MRATDRSVHLTNDAVQVERKLGCEDANKLSFAEFKTRSTNTLSATAVF